jgi:hypothetical protein
MVMGGVSNYGSWNLYADTVLIQQGSSNQRTDGIQVTGHNDNFLDYPLIVNFATGGTHSLKLIKTSASDTLGVDYGGLMQDSSTATPFLVWDQPFLDATGYATSPNQSSQTIATAANAINDSLYWTWDRKHYPIFHVYTNSVWSPLNCLASDHIHPRNYGDSMLTYAAESVLPYNNSGYFKGIFQAGRSNVESNYDGVPRSVAWLSQVPTKADLSIYQTRANAGSINGTTNTVPLFTSSTTLGNSVITQSSSQIGIGVTPTTLLTLGGVSNQGITWYNAASPTQQASAGFFSNTFMLTVGRNDFTGSNPYTSLASAGLHISSASGNGNVMVFTSATNGAAATEKVNFDGSGVTVFSPTTAAFSPDVSTFGNASQMPFQIRGGGGFVDGSTTNNSANYLWAWRSDGQIKYTDSANKYPYIQWIAKTGNRALSWAWENGSHSPTRGNGIQLDTLNQFYINTTPTGTSSDSVLVKHGSMVQAVAQSSLGGSGYSLVQKNASSVTARTKLNFPTGSGLTATDNSGNTSTDITITSIPSAATATTQSAGDNSTKVATTAYVDGLVSYGSWTPTITAGTGIASSTNQSSFYTVVGNIVHVRASFSVTPSASGSLATITFTLPINSNNVAVKVGSGVATGGSTNQLDIISVVVSNTGSGNTTAVIHYIPSNTSSQDITFSMDYLK